MFSLFYIIFLVIFVWSFFFRATKTRRCESLLSGDPERSSHSGGRLLHPKQRQTTKKQRGHGVRNRIFLGHSGVRNCHQPVRVPQRHTGSNCGYRMLQRGMKKNTKQIWNQFVRLLIRLEIWNKHNVEKLITIDPFHHLFIHLFWSLSYK